MKFYPKQKKTNKDILIEKYKNINECRGLEQNYYSRTAKVNK